MKARIEIEHANGESEGFFVPRSLVFRVADSLCCGFEHSQIRATIDGTTYSLEWRAGLNPLWDKAGNTRYSLQA